MRYDLVLAFLAAVFSTTLFGPTLKVEQHSLQLGQVRMVPVVYWSGVLESREERVPLCYKPASSSKFLFSMRVAAGGCRFSEELEELHILVEAPPR